MEQIVSRQLVNEESKIRRECVGRRMAILGMVYRVQDTKSNIMNGNYYVKSESKEIFYYIEYKDNGNSWCSCPDNSIRGTPCKHYWASFYAQRLNLVQIVNHKLPISQSKNELEAIVYNQQRQHSWTEDIYDF